MILVLTGTACVCSLVGIFHGDTAGISIIPASLLMSFKNQFEQHSNDLQLVSVIFLIISSIKLKKKTLKLNVLRMSVSSLHLGPKLSLSQK